MKQTLTIVLTLLCQLCYGQIDIVNDLSGSGGITNQNPTPDRYPVNYITELPLMTINLNALLGVEVLTVGQTYTFTFDFTNQLDQNVILAEVRTECTCEQPGWSNNIVAPGGKRPVTMNILVTAPTNGTATTTVKLFVNNPMGMMPVAAQNVQLTYSATL